MTAGVWRPESGWREGGRRGTGEQGKEGGGGRGRGKGGGGGRGKRERWRKGKGERKEEEEGEEGKVGGGGRGKRERKEEEGKVGEEGGGEEHGRMGRRKKEEVKIEVLGPTGTWGCTITVYGSQDWMLKCFHTKQSSYLRQQSPRQQLVHFPPLSPGDVRGGGRGSSAGCPPVAGDSDGTPRPQTASCGAALWSCLH